MSILNSILKTFIGDKTKKDLSKITPLVSRINDYQKSKDGRIFINLTGITRFEILDEKINDKLYREFRVNYKSFEKDLDKEKEEINTSTLMKKAKIFFNKNGLLINWKEFDKLDQDQKINTLAMISPVTNEEKQKVLEAVTLNEKVKSLEGIINFYSHEVNFNNQTIQ